MPLLATASCWQQQHQTLLVVQHDLPAAEESPAKSNRTRYHLIVRATPTLMHLYNTPLTINLKNFDLSVEPCQRLDSTSRSLLIASCLQKSPWLCE
jgi:hypothetical protein